jgi:hypothetical protein
MKNRALILPLAILSLGLATAAQADGGGTVTGAAGGAVTGAVVGGPVGAVVGGAVGAIAGTAIDPPPQRVVTYVEQQPMPAERVVVEQPIVVGKPVPQTVVLTPIPEDPAYAYAIVNEQRVIVDPQSGTVVQVLQ